MPHLGEPHQVGYVVAFPDFPRLNKFQFRSIRVNSDHPGQLGTKLQRGAFHPFLASQDVDVEPGLALPSFQVDRAVLSSQKRFLFWECSWGSNMFLPCYKIHLLWNRFCLIDWHNLLFNINSRSVGAPVKKLSVHVGTVFLMVLKEDSSYSYRRNRFVCCMRPVTSPKACLHLGCKGLVRRFGHHNLGEALAGQSSVAANRATSCQLQTMTVSILAPPPKSTQIPKSCSLAKIEDIG